MAEEYRKPYRMSFNATRLDGGSIREAFHKRTEIFFGGTNLPISLKTKRRREGIWKTNLPFVHDQSEWIPTLKKM